jgi:N-acetyl-anhydromuramyl-L-alanine amidase AmpD
MLVDYDIKGPPDLTIDRFIRILTDAGSPATGEAAAIYASLDHHGVRPSVWLAFGWVESKLGREGIVAEYNTHNMGNVRSPELPALGKTIDTPRGRFATYLGWTEGAYDWGARMVGPKYAGADLTTVRQVLPKYAPSSDSNDPDAYARAALAKIEEWVGATTVALSKPTVISKPSPNRNGYAGTRRVDAVIWHVTAGGFAGSLGWLTNPSSGASANYLINKDGAIYELVPPDQDAWANGAVAKPDTSNPLIPKWLGEKVNFNQRTVSIETVREESANERPGGFTEAQHRALVALTAWLCQTFRLTPDRTHIFGHRTIDSVNRPHCPGLAEAEWDAWVGEIKALVQGSTPPPQPPPPFQHAPGFLGPPLIDHFDWSQGIPDAAGIITHRMLRVFNDETGASYELSWDASTGFSPAQEIK